MQKFSSLIFGTFLLISTAATVRAQSLAGGFMAGKGHGSVVVSGTTEHYNDVFLAPEKIEGVPIFQEVRVNSLSLYANYGLTDNIDVVVSLPYVQSKGKAPGTVIDDLSKLYSTQGYTNVRQGIQDITALLKFKSYSHEIGSSILDLLGVVSFSTPLSDYQSNTGYGYIIAIGNHANKYTASGIAHLKTSSGVFATAQVGYSLRTGLVPNALIGEAKVGYAGPRTYLEGYVAFQESNGGTDISQEGFTGFFPSTRVNYVRLGASAYRPIANGFGVTLGANTYVAGRNIGKAVGYSAGVTYNF